MTEQTDVNTNVATQPSNELTHSAETVETQPEKVVPQSVVDKTVKTAKHLAYEAGKRDALLTMSQQQAQPPAVPVENQVQNQVGQQPNMQQQGNAANLQQMVADTVQREQARIANEMRAHQVVNQFVTKMQLGSQSYDDFEQTVAPLNLPSIPQIVELAAGVDNTHDVMYDLGKNPGKLGSLLMLSQTNPQLAQQEMQKLSLSIKKNKEGQQQQFSSEPLSQISPSVIKGDNSAGGLNKYDHAYFRKKYR